MDIVSYHNGFELTQQVTVYKRKLDPHRTIECLWVATLNDSKDEEKTDGDGSYMEPFKKKKSNTKEWTDRKEAEPSRWARENLWKVRECGGYTYMDKFQSERG